jgi:hypothetical protein
MIQFAHLRCKHGRGRNSATEKFYKIYFDGQSRRTKLYCFELQFRCGSFRQLLCDSAFRKFLIFIAVQFEQLT